MKLRTNPTARTGSRSYAGRRSLSSRIPSCFFISGICFTGKMYSGERFICSAPARKDTECPLTQNIPGSSSFTFARMSAAVRYSIRGMRISRSSERTPSLIPSYASASSPERSERYHITNVFPLSPQTLRRQRQPFRQCPRRSAKHL